MKVDRIIATIALDEKRSLDMELPVFLPVGELADKILDALQNLIPAEFEAVSEIGLSSGGQELASDSTLASVGLWDGSVLGIIRR